VRGSSKRPVVGEGWLGARREKQQMDYRVSITADARLKPDQARFVALLAM
jgi:hypothetical protein